MNAELQLFDGIEQVFEPSQKAALRRLQAFLPNSGTKYANQRNYDRGPNNRSNVSLLSPYTRHRVITEQSITEYVLGKYALSTADKFIQEVCWRTYWKGWLEHRPSVWSTYLTELSNLQKHVAANSGQTKALNQAETGATGIDCFDAWAIELVETGYLHNHARMWFASIWIFTLRLPWHLGAAFFMRHLKDGDPASNTLSWRWVAGLHTRDKTYTAREGNIRKYTEDRFDPQGVLATEANPINGPENPAPGVLPVASRTAPNAPTLLILHEDELDPQTLNLPVANIRAVALMDTVSQTDAYAQTVRDFKMALFADTIERIKNACGVEAKSIKVGPSAKSVDQLQTLCDQTGCEQIVLPLVPVGYASAALAPVVAQLRSGGCEPVILQRPWDAAFWPLASKGFFKLKSKIPGVLNYLGIWRT